MPRDQRALLHRHDIARALTFQHGVAQTARRDQHMAAHHRITMFGLLNAHRAQAVEAAGEGTCKAFGHMLHHHDARGIGGQRLQHLAQRLGAAGGGADHHHHFGCPRHRAARRRRQNRIGGEFGRDLDIGRRTPRRKPGAGRRLYGIANMFVLIDDVLGNAHTRFADHINRAGLQRLKQRVGTIFHQRGTHHHGNGVLAHQLAKKCDAIHPRHFDVQRDDVGYLFGDVTRGGKGVCRCGDHLDLWIGREDLLQRLAHAGAVINDQHANFARLELQHVSSCCKCCRQARRTARRDITRDC